MTTPLIPTSTRAVMRRIRTRTLVDTAQVQVRTQSDVPGGVAESWTTAATLPCRVQKPSQGTMERFAAGQLTAKPDADVAFAPGTTIASTSRVVASGITETDAGNVAWSRTLEILGDSGPTSVTVERVYPARDV